MPGVFPDYPAPVVRNTDDGSEMVTMRWGMPPPPRTGGPAVTNIRNTSSPHWRMWLKPENRCLVPANSFAEYAPEPNPETRPDLQVRGLAECFCAYLWRRWTLRDKFGRWASVTLSVSASARLLECLELLVQTAPSVKRAAIG